MTPIAASSKRCVHEFALNHISKAALLLTWQADEAGLIQFWQHLHHQPLIAMGFRFRRSVRLGPLRFNFGKSGLSSISLGGRGASFNIPNSR